MRTIVTDRLIHTIRDNHDGTESTILTHNGRVIAETIGPARPKPEPPTLWPFEGLYGDGQLIAWVPLPVRPDEV